MPAPNPIVNVQQVGNGEAQNQDEYRDDNENEVPPENANEEVNEIRELTEEEIAARQQRDEQERRELEARLAQGPLEYPQLYFDGYGDRYGNELAELAREGDNAELTNRVNRLNTLYYRLLYAPQGQELMERIRNYIATVGFTFDRSTASLQEQISIADALIHEAEEMLQRAEQQRGEELLREEIQHGLDTLALILQRTHTGLPGGTDLYTDVQTFLANRKRYTHKARIARAGEQGLALEIQEFLATIDGDFTVEHLERLNELLDRAREIMMNRARAYTRFDTDQLHIRNNDLQLAQMLGIDKEYIQEKIKIKIKMSANDITGTIELPDGDTVTFNFMVGSGTLVLTGSGNTVIRNQRPGSLRKQLKEAGILFSETDANGYGSAAQLPTSDCPFVVRNLIIGDGITEIDKRTFGHTMAPHSVYIMGPVRFVDCNAFSAGGSLVEVGFAQPEVFERIDELAFSYNYHLVSINIPQNADIAENAFRLCNNLKKQGCPYCKE